MTQELQMLFRHQSEKCFFLFLLFHISSFFFFFFFFISAVVEVQQVYKLVWFFFCWKRNLKVKRKSKKKRLFVTPSQIKHLLSGQSFLLQAGHLLYSAPVWRFLAKEKILNSFTLKVRFLIFQQTDILESHFCTVVLIAPSHS